jgi:hypothetical protein
MEVLWRSYGGPIEVLWRSYGCPLEVHGGNFWTFGDHLVSFEFWPIWVLHSYLVLLVFLIGPIFKVWPILRVDLN